MVQRRQVRQSLYGFSLSSKSKTCLPVSYVSFLLDLRSIDADPVHPVADGSKLFELGVPRPHGDQRWKVCRDMLLVAFLIIMTETRSLPLAC